MESNRRNRPVGLGQMSARANVPDLTRTKVFGFIQPGDAPSPKTFTPTGDMVAFQLIQTSNRTEGGVVIPDTAKDTWETPVGIVVAIGPETKWVKPGQKIIVLNETPLIKVRHKGAEFYQIEEKGIVGVLDDSVPV